jgi:hypothetical protein
MIESIYGLPDAPTAPIAGQETLKRSREFPENMTRCDGQKKACVDEPTHAAQKTARFLRVNPQDARA